MGLRTTVGDFGADLTLTGADVAGYALGVTMIAGDLDAATWWPVSVVAGDLTGDGRDDFLVGLPNGELVAIHEEAGKGIMFWNTLLDAPVIEAILADIDGDGLCEVIVHLDDGTVRVLK